MKWIKWAFVVVLLTAMWADSAQTRPPFGVIVGDEDGTNRQLYTEIKVSNGDTTDNGDGTCSIDSTGAAGNYVEDAAYGAGWNTDTTHSPSQNAVYDKISTMTDLGSTIDDTEMTTEDFGDFTNAGGEDGFTLDTDSVADNEIDYTNVTCADITTTDCGAVTSSGTVTAAAGFDCTGAADCDIGSADILDVSIFEGGNTYVFDDGLTIPTGLALTVGATAWTSAGAADTIDGEALENDSVDDDALDFGDITCTDLTMTDCGAITSTGVVDFGGATSFEFPSANGPTTDAVGECAIDSTDDALECYVDGSASQVIATQTKYFSTSFDPGVLYTSDHKAHLFPVRYPHGIRFLTWYASCNVNPDVEMDMSLMYADEDANKSWITLANKTVMDFMDTTNGYAYEETAGNINSGNAVAVNKLVYIQFCAAADCTAADVPCDCCTDVGVGAGCAAPEGTCQQLTISGSFVIEDD